jgi:SAM-dependent methyltransferase
MADRLRAPQSPRTAVVWSVLRSALEGQDAPIRVLDSGGGSGLFAVPLAELGHEVTVVDASPDALAVLLRRAAEAGVAERVHPVQGDADNLLEVVDESSFHLVLCHSLLEVVDDPATSVRAIAETLVPGGYASILAANRHAGVLSRALSGHFTDARTALVDPSGRSGPADAALRRFDLDTLTALIGKAGLTVLQSHGVRVVADLVPGALLDGEPGALDALRELELAASETPPFRDIATQLHVLAKR